MYTSPDLIKVKINVSDSFAAYAGCPMDQFGNWTYTVPCEGSADYRFVGDTFIGIGWGDGCYTTQKP